VTCETDSLQGGRWTCFGIDTRLRLLVMDLRTISLKFQTRVILPSIASLPSEWLERYLMNREEGYRVESPAA
jgi:hypothetical protein